MSSPLIGRWLRRISVWIAALMAAFFIGVPTVWMLSTRSRILSAVSSASKIRLEEYSRPAKRILSSRQLAPGEFSSVASAFPVTVTYGFPGVIARCFVPHHRVVIIDGSGKEVTLDVCFGCEQVRLPGEGIEETPLSWQEPLRRLFVEHGVPIRERYETDYGEEKQE